MKSLKEFNSSISAVFTDIDGTLTNDGRILPSTYQSLWDLHKAGIFIIPVTGRPAGWCELIARQWPVHGVIGENGAFYFRMHQGKMRRHFYTPRNQLKEDRKKLRVIKEEVLKSVPGCRVASDQFSRLYDLAIDFAEDVKTLPKEDIAKIVAIFEKHGATAKVSHIHVNGWYGHHDKGSACLHYAQNVLGFKTRNEILKKCAYVGDSPNDEPLFEIFPNSFGVANIVDYKDFMKTLPQFVSSKREGHGFSEIAERVLTTTS